MTFREAVRVLLADGGWKDAIGALMLTACIAGAWVLMYVMGC